MSIHAKRLLAEEDETIIWDSFSRRPRVLCFSKQPRKSWLSRYCMVWKRNSASRGLWALSLSSSRPFHCERALTQAITYQEMTDCTTTTPPDHDSDNHHGPTMTRSRSRSRSRSRILRLRLSLRLRVYDSSSSSFFSSSYSSKLLPTPTPTSTTTMTTMNTTRSQTTTIATTGL